MKSQTIEILAGPIPRTACTCGRVWETLPMSGRYMEDDIEEGPFSGAYFECECLTTIFIPKQTLESFEKKGCRS